MIRFNLNSKPVEIDVDPNMPLLWALRDILGMTGTKFGCGMAQCGACTVHLDGQPIRSCVMPLSAIADKEVSTIEGLSASAEHPVQQAWLEHNVPQCGYCQSGQIMSAVALLNEHPDPDDETIDSYMQGNICRCGTYPRIKAAIKTAAKNKQSAFDYSLGKEVGGQA
ncbi:(2Fe-2S)-binding protein [Paraglaciecola chathamensis]|jgi:isoquinoline 1-oxidoreductase alpha subunit|uniref:(2Fe-2S)-binding protein n=3 Tax=Paraglaciecola chathamensis TaxID=368405 RepID=A0A8H9IA19_9ALTE|nr:MULTISPECIES: (2Fe-2S)-binding protein [Paraglaciecola]AEE23528.1 (2Fe-2S)-binding domain-containing protein [Glaciecola sp. 4H-3-7+YE-5]MBJ2136254.1 (2Fe-2S)-binding protein [Paraglaciecola chathamensis]MBU3016527.1 (2Fe-2S)-binding protein [Paraglaciecola agarilytica]MDO6558624.1 (2Fe-2S)-binding protein [Paraglaciecola chathamensis]MDO6838273.1 (2Fe-2S)-binding protein [Paraglaciecola chathamensis]